MQGHYHFFPDMKNEDDEQTAHRVTIITPGPDVSRENTSVHVSNYFILNLSLCNVKDAQCLKDSQQ